MNKYFLFIFIFFNSSILLWSQNDFFPLKIGNQWNYSYKSIEKEYYDISFMFQMTLDSGNVKFNVIDSSFQDSIIIWKIKEQDIIERYIQNFNFDSDTTDTTYTLDITSFFQLIENLDSFHTIRSKSFYEVFTFPIRWDSFPYASSNISITRFSQDSSILVLSEGIFHIAFFSDYLIFHQNKGLFYAQSIIDKGPNVPFYYKWEASLTSFITSIDEEKMEIPKKFTLSQNYPNPFNPITIIEYEIPFVGTQNPVFIKLKVYDILGREIATLVQEEQSAGEYRIEFNADKYKLSSGIYFYKLEVTPIGRRANNTSKVTNFIEVKKMILLK